MYQNDEVCFIVVDSKYKIKSTALHIGKRTFFRKKDSKTGSERQ